MDGTIDSPALALFNPPAPKPALKSRPITQAPRHFVSRSLHNLRQGNIALFIVFCGCFVIFVRALFGAGYDEGYSADADAAVQKHPSLLSRWGPHSQRALEQQWKKLRTRDGTGAGLWAKIRKEDEGSASSRIGGRAPGHDALHWLRVMEDKALTGLGRRAQHPADVAAEADPVADAVAQAPLAARPEAPALPEHDISEDLDEHDVHDEEDHHGRENVQPAPVLKQHEESAAAPPPSPASDAPIQTPAASASAAAESASSSTTTASSSSIEAAQVSPSSPELDPEHDDTDDEPVYHKKEETK
ncbi:hypothetical protein EXIGLDRAFT_774825 [Exidia glandulosa HHB12029]|uniref:Transmembrane protein n=1 Tax=Exidia glandulosa HHB12029 TaxID=1314781 RepID=A0A165E7A4_EXIGL|nr:hypothetical protein EXIGLDRAFT_774825 [Exidia glandulosa HHB12029]